MEKRDVGKKPNFWDDFRAITESLNETARILSESAARMRESTRIMDENTAKLRAANAELRLAVERMKKADEALAASVKKLVPTGAPEEEPSTGGRLPN